MRSILPKSDAEFRKILNLFRNYLSKSALINETRRLFGKLFIAKGQAVRDYMDVPPNGVTRERFV
jgi:hypothetical protein